MNNSLLNATPSIQAYFSHSYRADDRKVNLFFWKLFSDEGFFFTIDPQSTTFVIPHLERMMRFSDCFIAVVTHRIEPVLIIDDVPINRPQPQPTHSPYIAFENFLAELAAKPRLLFVENDLEFDVFGTNDCVYDFDRNLLKQDESRFKEIVHGFAQRAKTYNSYNMQLVKSAYYRKKAGILIQETQNASGYNKKIISSIQATLRSVGGYTSEVISPRIDGLQKFVRKLSELELIVIDISDLSKASDILAIIQSKAIPCIKIAKYNSNISLDSLRAQGLLKDYFIGKDNPIITWKDKEELVNNIYTYLNRFTQARMVLDTFEQGKKYFDSAGRKPHKIFISNPGSLNRLALNLVAELQTSNIQYFQYQSNSSIEVGRKWEEVLDQELRKSNIFVALVNDDYHTSQYCQKELKTAFERWGKNEVTILPYLCEETRFPDLIRDHIQCQAVHAFPQDQIVKIIYDQLEKELLRKEENKMNTKMKILFFASNPTQTPSLMLDEEIHSIEEKIRASDYRDSLKLISHFATRPDDLQQKLLENQPTIVHFSGHGSKAGEIILMDNNRQPKSVSADALKLLFTNLKDNVRVIVLNACYSKKQASAISEVIDFVIGMNISITDDAAIAFAASFYRAIGFGRTIKQAFDSGRTAILLEGISEEDTPELLVRPGADASTTRLIDG